MGYGQVLRFCCGMDGHSGSPWCYSVGPRSVVVGLVGNMVACLVVILDGDMY